MSPRSGSDRLLTPFLRLNFTLLILLYAWLLMPILRDGGYMPAWTDEFGYVLDARSFRSNGTLHAARLKQESISRAFEVSTHGPAYILLQGGLARLFGDPVDLSLWPNVVTLTLTLLFVFAYPIAPARRLAIAVLLLLNFSVLLYAFTWMVETYHVLFGVTASLLLVTLYRTERDTREFRLLLAAYLVLLLTLSLFRVSYALWALGTLPLARTRNELLRYGLTAVLVLALAVLAMKLFTASYPLWPLSRASDALRRGDSTTAFWLLLTNVRENLLRFFVTESRGLSFYMAMKYLLLPVAGALLIGAVSRRDRLALAACLVLAAHLVLLLVLYDAKAWREHRHLAPVFYLLVIVLVVQDYRKTVAIVYLALLAMFPEVYGYLVKRILPERQMVAHQWAEARQQRDALAQLADLLVKPGGGTITVLHAKGYYSNLSIFPLAVPVRSRAGQPIRYTANLGRTPDVRRFGRVPIDYLLLPPGAGAIAGWKEIFAGPYFTLFSSSQAAAP